MGKIIHINTEVIKNYELHNAWLQKLIKNDQFLNEVRQTDVYVKIENHVKTPLHRHILTEKLKTEQWDEDTR